MTWGGTPMTSSSGHNLVPTTHLIIKLCVVTPHWQTRDIPIQSVWCDTWYGIIAIYSTVPESISARKFHNRTKLHDANVLISIQPWESGVTTTRLWTSSPIRMQCAVANKQITWKGIVVRHDRMIATKRESTSLYSWLSIPGHATCPSNSLANDSGTFHTCQDSVQRSELASLLAIVMRQISLMTVNSQQFAS